jgi:hypothetical protein
MFGLRFDGDRERLRLDANTDTMLAIIGFSISGRADWRSVAANFFSRGMVRHQRFWEISHHQVGRNWSLARHLLHEECDALGSALVT